MMNLAQNPNTKNLEKNYQWIMNEYENVATKCKYAALNYLKSFLADNDNQIVIPEDEDFTFIYDDGIRGEECTQLKRIYLKETKNGEQEIMLETESNYDIWLSCKPTQEIVDIINNLWEIIDCEFQEGDEDK